MYVHVCVSVYVLCVCVCVCVRVCVHYSVRALAPSHRCTRKSTLVPRTRSSALSTTYTVSLFAGLPCSVQMMGAEESKSSGSSSCPSFASGCVDFPNACRKESEATAWTLLHQVMMDKWKEGHAGQLITLYLDILIAHTLRIQDNPSITVSSRTVVNGWQ